MNIPANLYYTKEHEWVKIEAETATIGITDYAQHALGDVTFVECPKIGLEVKQFQGLATVESVKAASDIFSPLSGKVTEINTALDSEPALINQSCYEKAWIAKIKIKDASEKNNLMDAPTYKKYVEGLEH
ncbi:MAG TPA: glycine cleavage system protein GcvH [Candidatus Omnitrophota bacterium]|nr:glycine cleavage system protein GcvH [Candidatus Omnitrophota bacterium]